MKPTTPGMEDERLARTADVREAWARRCLALEHLLYLADSDHHPRLWLTVPSVSGQGVGLSDSGNRATTPKMEQGARRVNCF
jgi:hypothetical protein